jgi:hypothetical protein
LQKLPDFVRSKHVFIELLHGAKHAAWNHANQVTGTPPNYSGDSHGAQYMGSILLVVGMHCSVHPAWAMEISHRSAPSWKQVFFRGKVYLSACRRRLAVLRLEAQRETSTKGAIAVPAQLPAAAIPAASTAAAVNDAVLDSVYRQSAST